MIQIKLDGVKVETIYYGKCKKERWIEVDSDRGSCFGYELPKTVCSRSVSR